MHLPWKERRKQHGEGKQGWCPGVVAKGPYIHKKKNNKSNK
jgi:hypothetical protein